MKKRSKIVREILKPFLFASFHDCPVEVKGNKLIHSDEQYVSEVWE